MVLIDDRDGSRDLATTLALRERSQLARLEGADIMLTGHGPNDTTLTIGIEYKSVHDLLASISSGRLAGHQIPEMLKPGRFDHTWLLVYGAARPGQDNYLEVQRHGRWQNFRLGRTPVPYSYLEGFLLTMQMFTPVRLKWVGSEEEAAKWISILDRWLSKKWELHKGMSVFNESGAQAALPGANPVETTMAKVAAQIPGIGWTRGWSAAKYFESVEEMMNAPATRWEEIAGIGPVLAKSARDTIRRKK